MARSGGYSSKQSQSLSSLRPSAYLGGLCGNGYFTAEARRYAEDRRENLFRKNGRICVLGKLCTKSTHSKYFDAR
jgi:hypothetical protein